MVCVINQSLYCYSLTSNPDCSHPGSDAAAPRDKPLGTGMGFFRNFELTYVRCQSDVRPSGSCNLGYECGMCSDCCYIFLATLFIVDSVEFHDSSYFSFRLIDTV